MTLYQLKINIESANPIFKVIEKPGMLYGTSKVNVSTRDALRVYLYRRYERIAHRGSEKTQMHCILSLLTSITRGALNNNVVLTDGYKGVHRAIAEKKVPSTFYNELLSEIINYLKESHKLRQLKRIITHSDERFRTILAWVLWYRLDNIGAMKYLLSDGNLLRPINKWEFKYGREVNAAIKEATKKVHTNFESYV